MASAPKWHVWWDDEPPSTYEFSTREKAEKFLRNNCQSSHTGNRVFICQDLAEGKPAGIVIEPLRGDRDL